MGSILHGLLVVVFVRTDSESNGFCIESPANKQVNFHQPQSPAFLHLVTISHRADDLFPQQVASFARTFGMLPVALMN